MFFYSIAIKIYVFFVHLISPFHAKAKKAIAGRRDFFKVNRPDMIDHYIWFHCASLGEFEQGRPLIEKIRSKYPQKKILLSFFSPSGYEIRKDYSFADKVIYLPFDSSLNARKFFQTFKIDMAIFVKYDVWPFYLKEILNNNIPVFLTSAVFRKDQFFFRWYGNFLKKMLNKMNRIFVQDKDSLSIALDNGLKNIELAGDTRVDRVLKIKEHPKEMKEVQHFIKGENCVIFGSVYRSDEDIIGYINDQFGDEVKIIIAPHQITGEVLDRLKKRFSNSILFNDLKKYTNERILLIDHIGSLSQLYQFANMVYIGGGFEKGIHNILEPAVFNIPLFFGPKFQKFPEASSLIVEKLAFSDVDPQKLAKTMVVRPKENELDSLKERSQKWFSARSGATNLIFKYLEIYF